MFGRKKDSQNSSGSVRVDTAVTETENHSDVKSDPEVNSAHYTAPKGKPTPSRKQQQEARRQPLVPQDRKAAKEASRQALREERVKENIAMQTGDEKYLPIRDKGPQRRYIRDYIDSRFNLGDYMMIVILIVFVGGLFLSNLQTITLSIMWGFLLLVALDVWLMWRGLKKHLIDKFGEVAPGSTMYAINRAIMIRRFRLPKPQVKRGQRPQ